MPAPCSDQQEVVGTPDAMDVSDRSCKAKVVYIITHAMSVRLLLKGQLAYMRERGFEVVLITSPDPCLPDIAEYEGVSVLGIPMEREISLSRDLVSLVQLIRALRALRPDLVVAATPKGGLLGMIAARLAGVPARIYAVFGLRLETARGLKQWILSTTERIAAGCAQRVLCVSNSLREECIRRRLFPREKSAVIGSGTPNGIDPSRFGTFDDRAITELRAQLGLPVDQPVIGFVGRMTRDKGVSDLFYAFERLLADFPEARLLFVGDFEQGDPVPANVAHRIRTHPQIVITGFVDDPAPYYQVLDVLCFPSYREGLGYAPLEAAASHRPVVGYQATGVVDAVVNGVTGTLVRLGDIQGLALALASYLSSPELRSEHGRAGRDRVLREFHHDVIREAVHREFLGLLHPLPSSETVAVESVPAPHASPSGLPGSRPLRTDNLQNLLKRALDVGIAGPGLLLISPALVAIALAVRITDGSPILFLQRRPGLFGQPFLMYKFRTMTDARDSQGELRPDSERLTRLGRFLRRTSLDELPELFNVLRGEMSLVGPRPLLLEYLDRHTPEQSRRYVVRPGITGWAQVHGRNDISWEEKFALDVWYVDHWSIWLDLRILFATVGVVLWGRGVQKQGHATTELFQGSHHQQCEHAPPGADQ